MQSTDTLDQAFLRSIQVPAVDPEQVSLVTDETTCTQALSAFNAERPQATPVSAVTVIRVGSGVYVVTHPDVKQGEYGVHMVFDSTFTFLDSYLR